MCRLIAACIAAVVWSGALSAAPARPTIVQLLDRYAAHDFEAPVALAGASASDAADVASSLDGAGSRWTMAAGPAAAPARRLVAATFALDVVRVWSVGPMGAARWASSRHLLAWGCAELRRNPVPLEAERWWHLAAVGLFEGRYDALSLIGAQAPMPAPAGFLMEGAEGHLAHALARFPHEARFRLAQAVAREIATPYAGDSFVRNDARPTSGVLPREITTEYINTLKKAAGDRAPRFQTRTSGSPQIAANELARISALRDALTTYGTLFDVEDVAAEAHLRFGYTALRLGDRAAGIDHLERAQGMTTDPSLSYLAALFLGSAQDRIGRTSDAIDGYRRALELAPGARTAGTHLVSALLRDSRVEDASDVADRLLTQPAGVDPISRLLRGDVRLVAEFLEQLKRALP